MILAPVILLAIIFAWAMGTWRTYGIVGVLVTLATAGILYVGVFGGDEPIPEADLPGLIGGAIIMGLIPVAAYWGIAGIAVASKQKKA